MIICWKNRFKAAAILILAVISSLNAQSPDSLWRESVGKFEAGDFHGALQNVDKVMGMVSSFPEGYYNRGILKLRLGDIAGACSDLQSAREAGLKQNIDIINYLCDKDRIRDYLVKEYYGNRKVYPEDGYRPQYDRGDTLRGALRPERECFDVFFYDLSVRIMPKKKQISGTNTVYFHTRQNTRTIQLDLFSNLKINSVTWKNRKLEFRREYNAFFVDFPEELKQGNDYSVTVTWEGKPVIATNPPWQGGLVWDTDENGNYWVSVACEHLGASSWWPVKDHLSDEPDSMSISLEVPEGYNAVSNGNLMNTEQVSGGYELFRWFVHYPVNSYDVTFYMGRYVSFDDTLITGNDTVMLNYNVLPEHLEIAKEHFRQTGEILSFYIDAFGDYPFKKDGFGLVESSYEGMEHQTAIAYGSGYRNSGYRDDKYDYIIVHESAHEWWGNAITAADMADAWIHEGFATYAEYMFMEKLHGYDEYMYNLNEGAANILNIWPMVGNYNVNEDSFVGNDIYFKGAMMLHCLRCIINDDSLFFSMIRDYAITRKYTEVSTSDFIAFVNNYAGGDYTPFFDKFLHDTGLPLLEYSFTREDGTVKLVYRWTEVEPGFSMPFSITTDKGISIRLEGTSDTREVTIPDAEWFNFYNVWKGYEGCPVNGFTYYNTKWDR